MATDMMPIPALCAIIIHTLWIIVFVPLVGVYRVFAPDLKCHTTGREYQAICGGFLAIYVISWFFEVALFIVGCRGTVLQSCRTASGKAVSSTKLSLMHTGTPLEVKKRQACIPLLYVMTFLWISQIAWAGKHFSHSLSVLPCTVRCRLPHIAYLSTYTVNAHIHLQAAHFSP